MYILSKVSKVSIQSKTSNCPRWLLLLFFALLSYATRMQAKVWSADDIPMVHLQDRNRYVCDPDGLMSVADRDSADFYLHRLQTECGIQTVFIVVNNVKNADCFRMAEDVGNKYGVGDKKNRRGLVVVMAVKDRRYFIAPGKGLEADLTDVECDDIARACIVKNMKLNDTDEAVVSTVKAFYNKFKTGGTGLGYDDPSESMDDDSIFAMIVVLLLCFGYPVYLIIRSLLETLGVVKPRKKHAHHRRRDDDDWFPPFILGGGGGFGGGNGFSGGSFGGGSFGGGGAGGGW